MEKLKSELTSLKSQINPHFLFNTLNGIYGLALTKSEKTANSILKLSTMMRYVLKESTAEKVPLEKEISYIQDYVAFQKFRLTNKTKINLIVEGEIQFQQIPPLIFVNFIENAFKYGVSNEIESIIEILFLIKESSILFQIKNKKLKKNENAESNEVGIKNTQRRLDFIFKNNYSLDIINTEKEYQIILKISLK